MAEAILMPKQGQSVETCILTQWHKKVGDKVSKGDILFAYETDKASFEEEAEVEGILLDVFYEEGDEVPVLVNVAVVGQEGEPTEEFKSGGAETEEEKEQATTEEPMKAEESPSEVQTKQNFDTAPQNSGEGRFISPRAKNKAEKSGVMATSLSGTGPKGRVIERDVDAAIKEGKTFTPAGFEKAQKEGINAAPKGTGLSGSVTTYDLEGDFAVAGDHAEEKISNIRKIISENMHASLQNSAQLTHHMSADARKLLAARAQFKKAIEKEGGQNVTINDLVCYAVIKALKKNPDANAHFLGDKIRKFNKVHLGMAVDTPRGLMVPALRNADDLNIQGLSSQLYKLAMDCKEGKIAPELLASTAASFTVSNLGAYGVEIFTPVINLPQSGILGVNTIIKRPADIGGGVVGIVPFIGLSLTYDHRALDGAPASAFLRDIKLEIENLDYNTLI